MLYHSHSLIGPAASDKGQTVQAGADEVGGGEGVLGDEGDGEGVEAGRRGHRTAVTETGRTSASAGQNKLGGPREKKNKTKPDVTGNSSGGATVTPVMCETTQIRLNHKHTHWRRDTADGIVLPTENH